MSPWVDLDDQDVQQMISINVLHPSYLLKCLTPQLDKRIDEKQQKSAVVIVSSLASFMPNTGNLLYSCTKTFVSYLGEGLFYEFEGRIDCINYMPSSVATNLTASDPNQGKGGDYITRA